MNFKQFILVICIYGLCSFALQADVISLEKYKQLTNIPTVYVETFDGADITSETEYKLCRLIRVDKGNVEFFDSVNIRGRGNASWNFPKKPYRLKFSNKTKFLGKGFANAKNWTLLSNDGEKLMFRNGLTSYVGALAGLTFNPACKFVDMYLNGVYRGTYQISDQVDVRKYRVDIVEQDTVVTNPMTDITGGYLMEQDGYTEEGETYFYTPSGAHIRVHSPKVEVINKRQLDYITNFMNTVETALFSSLYRSVVYGYRKYIDSTSLVGWYLTSEIGSNMDIFHSTYFYKDRGNNHLFLGPVWDNDLGFNDDNRYGDETKTLMANVAYGSSKWFQQIRTDPWFRNACCSHFSHLYENGLDSLMLNYIDSLLMEIRPSVDLNYKIWNITERTHQDLYLFNTYDEYVADVKKFIVEHNAFLYRTFKNQSPSSFVLDPNSYYQFCNKRNEICVIGVLDSTANETQACLRLTANRQLAQLWDIQRDGYSTYRIKNAGSGLVLSDMNGKADTKGQFLLTTPVEGDSTQMWNIVPQTAGYFNLQNAYTKKILTDYAGLLASGNKLYGNPPMANDTSAVSRLWSMKPVTKFSRTQDGIQPVGRRIEYALAYDQVEQQLHFVAADLAMLIFKASVYDLNGVCLGSFRGDDRFDMNRFPKGTYIISWQFEGKLHSTKLLKIK
jgi:hypothetical protein